jgi:hypothetical protein
MVYPPGVVVRWGTLANVPDEVKGLNTMIDASKAPQYGISYDEH